MIFEALAVLGAGISAYGEYRAGKSAEAQGRLNAEIARRAGMDAIARGDMAANDVSERGRQIVGDATAAAGASGIDVGSRSVQDVLAATALMSEEDARRTRLAAAREAWGYKAQAAGFNAQAAEAGRAGLLAAGGTLLGGAATAYGANAYRVGQNNTGGG